MYTKGKELPEYNMESRFGCQQCCRGQKFRPTRPGRKGGAKEKKKGGGVLSVKPAAKNKLS